VPAQQRLRPHEETLPASPWQSSSRSGEKCPVGKSKARPLDLSPKDIQFVAEHDDLEILGGLALAIWDQQPEQHSNQGKTRIALVREGNRSPRSRGFFGCGSILVARAEFSRPLRVRPPVA
jgi:hypothetical protein